MSDVSCVIFYAGKMLQTIECDEFNTKSCLIPFRILRKKIINNNRCAKMR
jgi:hypothetical protein